MARIGITFSGFDDLAYQIDKAGGNLKEAVDFALTETAGLVQRKVNQASLPYTKDSKGLKGYATGEMFNALRKDDHVRWVTPTIAEVHAGFNLNESGGWHSIFVMYGTPKIAKDQKLYNSIKGTQIQHSIALLQETIMRGCLEFGTSEMKGGAHYTQQKEIAGGK